MNSSIPLGENSDVDSLAQTADLVCRVSETVSSEFYARDINYCQETLRSLLVKAPASPRYPTKETEVAHAQTARKGKGKSRPKRTEEEFEILDITGGPEGCISTIVPVEVVKLDEALKPHPSYEACTPLMRSISVGDDPHLMPFMPFSDDPEFDYMSYNEQHKFFLWQIPNHDRDCAYLLHLHQHSVCIKFLLPKWKLSLLKLHAGYIQNINCLWMQLIKLLSFHFS
jgi:histone-lysine N-methyltransferase EZH2